MLIGTRSEREDLGGGRQRLTLHLKPIAYRDANNQLRRITNALGASGDPLLPVGVDELVQFRIRDKLAGESPVLHFGKGGTYVRITPLGTNNVDGVVDGQSITFPKAWNNADYKVTVAGHRLQKDILLKTGHPSQFAFRIDSHAGLNLDTLETADFRILQPVLRDPKTGFDEPLKWVVGQQGGKTILTVTLPPGDHAGKVLDPTLSLQPDAAAGIDTMITARNSTINFGVYPALIVGCVTGQAPADRALIKFNLDDLPADAIISSAILSLYALEDYSSNARTFRVYRQKRAWVEGTRNGEEDNPATGATWNRYDTTTNWQTAGGFGANDCEQTDIGSRAFTATETLNEFKNFPLTPTTKAGLDLGNGWLIKADTETDDAYRFQPSDDVTAAKRPKLVIEYTVPVAPTVTTQAADQIAPTSARGNGNITDDGGAAITQHGVCWKAGADPVNIAGADGYTEEGAGVVGAFTSEMTGLTANTLYYYRAYATNSAGTSYGAAQSFTTAAAPPTVTTQAADQIGPTSARGNGNITSNGGAAITQHGVCWKKGADPVNIAGSDGHTEKGAGTEGPFTSVMAGLDPESTYYYRAYATNSAGTGYGTAQSFKTMIVASASGQAVSSGSAAGVLALLASAEGAAITIAAAAPLLALVGQASGEAASAGEVAGCLQLVAAAEGQAATTASATAFIGHQAAAEGQTTSEGTAYALLSLAGQVEGESASTGSASGIFELLAHAVGTALATATAVAVLALLGGALGEAVSSGSANGRLQLLAAAEGQGASTAAAGALVGHRGDAEGQSASEGTAYALLGLAAVAEGAAATTGETAGLLGLAAGAEGTATTTASADGISDLVAEAEGQGASQGAASGLLALIGEAEGQGTTTGIVVIVLPFFLGDLEPGQTVVIDCEYETVTIDGVNVLKDFVGEFFKLPPGASILKYADLEDSRDLTITITYKDKWI